MKKLILSLATLAPMFAGCQKPELEGTAHDEKQAFVASVEGFGAQTRTSLAPGNYVVWSSGDCLAIFQGSSIADEYILAEGSAGLNSGSFKWVADNSTMNGDFSAGTELPCNVAFYPYSDDLNLTGDMEDNKTGYVLSNVVLPNTQVYSANSFGNGAFPMVAVTENMEDHNLKFKNVLGAMKLQFKGNIAVKSIKVEGANGEKLSGAAKVTAYANNLTPAITMTGTDEVSKSVTLDCGDGAQLNTTEATDFFIALPPVLFQNGFTVIVTDVEKKEYTVTATDVNTVLRSSILVMPEITIESEDVENPEGGSGDSGNGYDYVDEYGINLGPGVDILGVVWAPVNCGYHANDYQWGKLYQWGRKYGQGYSGDLYDADDNITGLTSDATVPEFFQGPVSLEVGQSENNKNIFFISDNNDVYWDWLSPKDMTLWRSTSIKSEYDPCPEGWRVPTYSELNLLWEGSSAYWTTNDSGQSGCLFCGPSKYTDEVSQVFFPAAGSRYNYNGNANYRGQNGCYWSSYGSEIHGSDYLWFTKDKTAITELGDSRGSGYSVRCVHESSEVMEFIGVSEVKLSSTSLVLYEEGNAQLTAKVGPVDATNKTVVWRSWDSSIATVDQTGLVTAISEGTTRITATVGSCNTNCSVEVKPKRVVLDYVDEYGINHGKGTAIGMAIWAPVNCGYHVTDYQWGKLYQWGRKYGQGYDGDATTPEFSEGGVSLQDGQSSKNENVFFTCQDFPYDWLYQGDDQLWNSGTEDSPVKTEYDPCPAGWRVPTYAELEELSQNHSEWTINENSQSGCWFSGSSSYSSEVAQVFFPAAGYRYYNYGTVDNRGYSGNFWSSRANWESACYLGFNDGLTDMSNYGTVRAYGYSVRCVQD